MQVALFGSAARGTSDASSDFDVIAVVEDADAFKKADLQRQVSAHVGREVGLSIYSEGRLRSLWLEGSPFAWHLHLEAKPILGFDCRFIREWSSPSPYRSAIEDCSMMTSIIESVCVRLQSRARGCECYEAGLLYVGARNVAMFASEPLGGIFNFSRTAPYALHDFIEFPLTTCDYDVLVQARHATTRGGVVPDVHVEMLEQTAGDLRDWAYAVKSSIRRKYGV